MKELVNKIHDEVYQLKAENSDDWRAKLKKVLLKYTSTGRTLGHGATTRINVAEGTLTIWHTINNGTWYAIRIEGEERL